MGRICHLDVMDLWVRTKFTSNAAAVDKVLGTENPSDILTKHVDPQILNSALQRMGMECIGGRSAVAPQAMGVQNQLLARKQRILLCY